MLVEVMQLSDLQSCIHPIALATNKENYETAFGDDQIALIRLYFPPKRQIPPRFKIMGSCNGLLPYPYYVPINGGFIFAPRYCASEDSIFNGFRYDSSSDDYKVLFGIRRWRGTLETRVAIFSLRKNSWRMVQPPPANPPVFFYQSGPFVNGALHWLGRHGMGSSLLT
ncbi:hypothetical protein QQP08_015126 [Theobroma cacao]|nr:hypothetical protein QQP08_015126 [Theobroma cacao]